MFSLFFLITITIMFIYYFKTEWLHHYGIVIVDNIYTTNYHIWLDRPRFIDLAWIDENDECVDCYFLFEYLFCGSRNSHSRIYKIYHPSTFNIEYVNNGKITENPYKIGVPVTLYKGEFIIKERKGMGRRSIKEEVGRSKSLPLLNILKN